MSFIINNGENFQTNSYTHRTDTTNEYHLHRPNANLSCLRKSAFYDDIRTFNSLPRSLTSLRSEKAQFKVAIIRLFLCVKIIHNIKGVIVFFTAIILYALHTLYVLCVYDLFHILCSDSRAAIADLAKITTECLVWDSTEALKVTKWI
jgi:hypothetical protein